jgi:DNA integrity scanning protein DisA with diadenylate cyclase activity
LPLSENAVSAERHIGTRHRAAIGVTEQTDAVVVVVSEESGAVSIARAGRLSVQIDGEERLNKVLSAIVRPPRRTRQAVSPVFANLLHRIPRAVDRSPKLPT